MTALEFAFMPSCAASTGNHLLASLPPEPWQRWEPALEPVELALGQVLYEAGRVMSHVYFPTTAIVSLLYVMEDRKSVV